MFKCLTRCWFPHLFNRDNLVLWYSLDLIRVVLFYLYFNAQFLFFIFIQKIVNTEWNIRCTVRIMNWCLQCMVVASLLHTGHAHLILFHSCLQVIQINNYKKTLPFFWTNKIKLNFSFCVSSVLKRCLLSFRKCKTKLMESLLRLL